MHVELLITESKTQFSQFCEVKIRGPGTNAWLKICIGGPYWSKSGAPEQMPG